MKKRKYEKRTGVRAIKMMQRVRNRNNRNWMQLVELAFRKAPRETRKIISRIMTADEEISRWAKSI